MINDKDESTDACLEKVQIVYSYWGKTVLMVFPKTYLILIFDFRHENRSKEFPSATEHTKKFFYVCRPPKQEILKKFPFNSSSRNAKLPTQDLQTFQKVDVCSEKYQIDVKALWGLQKIHFWKRNFILSNRLVWKWIWFLSGFRWNDGDCEFLVNKRVNEGKNRFSWKWMTGLMKLPGFPETPISNINANSTIQSTIHELIIMALT